MSRAYLLGFTDGKIVNHIEYGNAWGGAARIWDALFKAYVPKKHVDNWMVNNGDDQRLWDLAKRKDLPECERAVHAFTFDKFYVKRDNFNRFADDLCRFIVRHPAGDRVDHLKAWSDRFRDNDFDAIGLHATSVSENPWYRNKECPHCGNSTDEWESVPLSEGTEVYELLNKQN